MSRKTWLRTAALLTFTASMTHCGNRSGAGRSAENASEPGRARRDVGVAGSGVSAETDTHATRPGERHRLFERVIRGGESFRRDEKDAAIEIARGLNELRNFTMMERDDECTRRSARCTNLRTQVARLDSAFERWCGFVGGNYQEDCSDPPACRSRRCVDIDLDDAGWNVQSLKRDYWNCGEEAIEPLNPERVSVRELLRQLPKPACIVERPRACASGERPLVDGGCAAPVEAARLDVVADRRARVYVDGCEVGLTPQRGLLVQPGLVTVSLKPLEPGLEAKVVTRRRRVSAGATLRVNERLCGRGLPMTQVADGAAGLRRCCDKLRSQLLNGLRDESASHVCWTLQQEGKSVEQVKAALEEIPRADRLPDDCREHDRPVDQLS